MFAAGIRAVGVGVGEGEGEGEGEVIEELLTKFTQ